MLRIILIAHDTRMADMIAWLESRAEDLAGADLLAAWITAEEIGRRTGLPVNLLGADPAGAEGRARRMIAEGVIDLIVFLWNPRSPIPHEVDVDALLRLACDCDVPTALNPWTADYFVSELVGRGAWRRVRVSSERASKCIA